MTADAWDAHADTYARLFAPLTSPIAASLVRLTEHRLPPRARILDVACGSGALTLPAARWARAAAADVVATDYSPAMVDATRAAADAEGLAVRCEVHDGMALGLPDATFDAVYSCFGIFLFPDRVAGWREAARVLRPGGTLAVTAWRGPAHNELLRAQMEPMWRALPERLRVAPARSWMEIAEPDALLAEVTASAPLVDARVHVLTGSIVLPSPAACWHAMQNNPVVGALLRACTADELAAVEASVLADLTERAGAADAPFVLHASCHALIATKAG
jgi:SAM-dependent methyltransferase